MQGYQWALWCCTAVYNCTGLESRSCWETAASMHDTPGQSAGVATNDILHDLVSCQRRHYSPRLASRIAVCHILKMPLHAHKTQGTWLISASSTQGWQGPPVAESTLPYLQAAVPVWGSSRFAAATGCNVDRLRSDEHVASYLV